MSEIVSIIMSDLVIPVAIAAIPVLASFVLNEWRKFLKAKASKLISEQLEEELDSFVGNAVRYAEEVAHKALKLGLAKPGPEEKEKIAVDYLLETAVKHNLTPEKALKLILAGLASRRRENGTLNGW